MKWSFLKRRRTWVFAAVVLVLAVVFTQCELTRHSFDIDVNSGRTREQRFVLGVLVSTRVEETPFSKLVAELSLSREPPDWRFGGALAYLAGGELRECGVYGGAAADCLQVGVIIEFYESEGLEWTGKREAIVRLLDLMRKGEVFEMGREVQRMSAEFHALAGEGS